MEDEGPCLSCHKTLPVNGVFARCSECGHGYHFGNCAGTDEKTYKAKNWKCSTCRKPKVRYTQNPQKGKKDQEPDVATLLTEINVKLTSLATITEKVDTLMIMKETIVNIEKSVQHMSDQYDEVLKHIKEQDNEIAEIKSRLENVERNNGGPDVQQLRISVNNLEQYSRRQNLEIHGLPRKEHENLLHTVNELAAKLELPELAESDVEGMHRLPARADKIPVVLIRFNSRATKEKWIKKNSSLRERQSSIRLFDNLTAANKKLLWLTKAEAQEKDYQFTWQKDGSVFVRRRQGDRAIKIENEDDLQKIN